MLRTRWLVVASISVVILLTLATVLSVSSAPILTLSPITWNVIGLDSNNVNVGPNNFPVGVRVCNTGPDPATNVLAAFSWDDGGSLYTGDPYINLRGGSLSTVSVASIGAGSVESPTCKDLYFEVSVTRNAAAYDRTRRYRVNVTADGGISLTSQVPRELYVEHLISQSRNSTTNVRLDGVSIPAGGTMALVVGSTYTIRLEAATATNGYEQIENFINFPNTIFLVNSVATTYSANDLTSPDPDAGSKLYADGCSWENDPNSPNYRSCLGTGKYGGTVMVDYNVTIIGGGGTTQTLNSLIYDFSGSSYHYNADYAVGARIAAIIDPTLVTISKSFAPNPTSINGVSTLTFTLSNPNAAAISGVNFTDIFPTTPGAMVTAAPATFSSSGCGTPVIRAPIGSGSFSAGAPSVAVSGATIPAGVNCTISVNITVPTVSPPAYSNTTSNVFIGSVDTGNHATASLTANNTPPPPAPTCGLGMAAWTIPPTATNPPDLTGGVPTSLASDVPVAAATAGSGIVPLIRSNLGYNDTGSWSSDGGIEPGAFDPAQNNYFRFAVDTRNYTQVSLSFWANRTNNGPRDLYIYYGTSGSPPETLKTSYNGPGLPNQTTWYPFTVNFLASETSTTGITYFYIYAANSNNSTPGSDLYLDEVTFTGCKVATPPTLTKAFSPNPVAVNGNSRLTFTLTNSNTIALSGVNFTDTLPAGLQVAATPNASTTCGGGPTWAPSAGSSALSFGSPTGGSIPARVEATNGSCTVGVDVAATTAGPHPNVSGFISSTQSGTNFGAGGSASATLTAVLPPVISKLFAPNPILAGGVSTLTFILLNPNPNNTLSGVAFTDTFPLVPAAMTVAAPLTAVNTCGGTLLDNSGGALGAGDPGIRLTGGTLAGGASCTVSVNVTAPVLGTYANASGYVSHVINAATVNGNTASHSLTVNAPSPAIGLIKQVGPSASGPWTSFLAVSAGSDVFHKFTVENSGDVPLDLTAPVVTDIVVAVNTLAAACTWLDYLGNPITLPTTLPVAGATDAHIITCVTGSIPAAAGSNLNTATASGRYLGVPYSDSSSATYATTGLTISKSATQSYYNSAGDVLNYNYDVQNTGSAPLRGPVTIFDDKATDEACPAVSTVGDGDDFLDPGETITCTATYAIQEPSDVTDGQVTNTAYATVDGATSNTDAETVYLAALTIDKDTTTASLGASGTVSYTLVVTNSGLVDLSNFQVTDTLPFTPGEFSVNSVTAPGFSVNGSYDGLAAGDVNLLGGGDTLAVGGSATLTINVQLNSAAAGTYDNTATATTTQTGAVDDDGLVANDPGTPGSGSDPETDEDVTIIPGPAIELTKTGTLNDDDGTPGLSAGDTISYAFTVTNTGDVTLTGITLADTVGGVTISGGPIASLAAGASDGSTFTGSYTVTQSDIDSGSFTNTATVTGTPPSGPDVNDPDSETVTLAGTPTMTVDKSSVTASLSAPGTVTYDYLVTNTGNVTLTGITLADDNDNDDLSCAAATLAPGGTTACTATHTFTQAELDAGGTLDNTVTTSSNEAPDATDSLSIPITQTPGLSLGKVYDGYADNDGSTTLTVGDDLNFTLTMRNTGNTTLTTVVVSDGQLTPNSQTCASVAPSGTCVLAGSYTVTQADVDAGSFTNTGTVTDDDVCPGAGAATCEDSVSTPIPQAPTMTVDKSSVTASLSAPGTVTYDYLVTNTGNVTLTGITLADDNDNDDLSCAAATLAPGGTTACTATHTFTQAELDAGGTLDNTVTTSSNEAPDATDNLSIPITQAPGLNVVKEVSDDDATWVNNVTVAVGDTVYYRVRVENTGNVTLTGLSMTDPACTLVRGADLTGDDDTDFEVGEEWAYTCQVTAFAGTQLNTATADSNETGPDTDGASYLGIGAPSINKNFAPDPIPALGVSTLTFTLTNPNSNTVLNSVGFSDTFPSSPGAMVVAASPNPTNTCGGTFTAVAGAGSVTLAGGSISASSSCTVSVDVTAPSAGTYDNTSSSVSSSNGGTGNAASGTLTVGAALVIDPALTKSGDPATARVGEVVTFTLQVFNNGTGDATGVVVTDLLPSFLDYTGIVAPGASSTSYDEPANTVTINYAAVQPGDLFTITITTTVNSLGMPPGGTNTASLLSATADADLNNNSSSALLTIVTGSGLRAPETGFAPDRATQLPQMPDQRIYETYGELTLRIPKLGLSTTIVGVPLEAEGWDVAWLSGQVGYLDGTTFPGWQGNSVLTGHVYLPSGLPGPFVDLGQLRWGDRAIIDSFGTRYTYEVRESALLRPDDPSIIRHEEQSWLTLLTCSGYQESTDTYLWRRVVRLVLIDAAWQGSSPGRSGR